MDENRTKDDSDLRNSVEVGQSRDLIHGEQSSDTLGPPSAPCEMRTNREVDAMKSRDSVTEEDEVKKVRKPWKQKKHAKSSNAVNGIEIFEGKGVARSASRLETTKPEGGYLKVVCKNDCEFLVPYKVVDSFQCVDVILHSDAVFKENVENVIRFPDIEPEIMEYVLRFVFIEHLNKLKAQQYWGADSPRLVFQFEVDPRHVMDLIYVAHFLGVHDLLNVAATMVARHLQDVPDLSSMPLDLAWCVAEQFSSQELYDAEERKDFLSLGLETGALWEKHCKKFLVEDIVKPNSSADLPTYDHWGACEGPPPTSWKALFISLDLQQLADRQDGSQNERFFTELQYKGKWAYNHTVRKMFFDWVLRSPGSLSFVSYTAQFPNLFSLHLHLLPLNTALPDGTIPCLGVGEILESHPLLQILDVSETEFTAEAAVLLSQSLRSHARIQVLRLAYNNIGTEGFTAIARVLPYVRTLKLLDVRENGISAFMAADAMAALQSSALEDLLLDGNFKIRDSPSGTTRHSSSDLEQTTRSQQTPARPSGNGVLLLLGIPHALKKLQLQRCDFLDDDIFVIVKALNQHKVIQKVDLADNRITTCGAISIFRWLQGNESLLELYLAGNRITDDCSEVLAQTLYKHPTLRKLSMKGNFSHFERRLSEVISAAATRGKALLSKDGLKFVLDLRMREISVQTRARIQSWIAIWSSHLDLVI